LSSISALLEVGDAQFEAMRLARAQLQGEYADDVRAGELTMRLDRDALEAYLRDSERVADWRRYAHERAYVVVSDDEDLARGYDAVGLLAEVAQRAGLTTVQQLDEFLHDHEDWGKQRLENERTQMRGEVRASVALVIANVVNAFRLNEEAKARGVVEYIPPGSAANVRSSAPGTDA
jgi:hypothetical protein